MISALLLGGCVVAAQPPVPDDLAGMTEWSLLELDGQETVTGSVVSLTIDMQQKTLFGSAGCNRFMTGFHFWRTGATGAWSWTFLRPKDDAYNDFDGASRGEAKDACIAYPPRLKIWTS